jgi:hypothetical protein
MDADEEHPDPIEDGIELTREALTTLESITTPSSLDVQSSTSDVQRSHLPADFPLTLQEETLGDASFHVPTSFLPFLASQYGQPNSIVIGSLYNGEEYIIFTDDCLPGDHAKLIAEGWPSRLIHFLTEANKQGHTYLRVIPC